MLTRRGFSLAELLVALVLTGIVLGTASSSLLRQQRTYVRIGALTDADAQSRAAALVMASQLSALEPLAGDLSAAQADDSSLQFRAVLASSFACADEVGAVTLVPDLADSVPATGVVADTHAGDTLWWRTDSTWRSAVVTATGAVTTTCTPPLGASGTTQRIAVAGADSIHAATPLRVTRLARYAIYRASDGTWQLGYREWNDATNRFAAPQPVAGPLLPRLGTRRSGFRYFTAAGAELVSGGAPIDVRSVARIRFTALTLVRSREGSDSVRADSVDVPLRRPAPP